MSGQGYWKVCDHCGDKYHVSANGRVDVYCRCLAKTQHQLRTGLAKLRYKLEK